MGNKGPSRTAASCGSPLRLAWVPHERSGDIVIDGDHLPGAIRVWYVELYMGPGSRTNYPGGVIPHATECTSVDPAGRWLTLRCTLDHGVVVEHRVTAGRDVVTFEMVATNTAAHTSDVAWGAPCIIVDGFTGGDKQTYLQKCFIFLEGRLCRLPVEPWATEGVETPGQVWCPPHVDRDDVESHPLSDLVPSHGLIGCFSKDERMVLAAAWQPYQDLFQGIIACLHADFRIDGLRPGQCKALRGRIYVTEEDIPSLLQRYEDDFPEHFDA